MSSKKGLKPLRYYARKILQNYARSNKTFRRVSPKVFHTRRIRGGAEEKKEHSYYSSYPFEDNSIKMNFDRKYLMESCAGFLFKMSNTFFFFFVPAKAINSNSCFTSNSRTAIRAPAVQRFKHFRFDFIIFIDTQIHMS